MARMRKPGTVMTAVIVVLAALIAWLAAWWWGDSGPRLPTEMSIPVPTRPGALPVLVLLAPGTVVETAPPPGWSDPVIKSVLNLASGDLNTLPKFAKTTATKFRTVIMADVRRDAERERYHLSRVGAGLCLTRDDQDQVISTDSLKEQGVNLGAIDGMVLGRAERALGRSRLSAMTPTFALYDSHVELADDSGAHHSILMRYALVVDPTTGVLRTAYWTMAEKSADRLTPESLILLPAKLVFRCGIHVAARRVIGNIAASWGFAMTALPSGTVIPMPPELQAFSLLDGQALDSAALEAAVRSVLGDRLSPPPPER
ncbi:MAG: hypothetical protein JWN86_4053 [Planctomycetota bacterium]|nr:hypothetical protein [Planctomycetota bacterium]